MMMFKQKIKLLEKIAKTGIASEKDITDLTAEKMLDLPGITIDEMRALLSLQQAIKKNQMYSWLMQADKTEGETDNG